MADVFDSLPPESKDFLAAAGKKRSGRKFSDLGKGPLRGMTLGNNQTVKTNVDTPENFQDKNIKYNNSDDKSPENLVQKPGTEMETVGTKTWYKNENLVQKPGTEMETVGTKTWYKNLVQKPGTETDNFSSNHSINGPFLSSNNRKFPDHFVKKLKGLRLEVMLLIFQNCLKNQTLASDYISLRDMAETLSTSVNTLRTSIKRLVKIELIKKEAVFAGSHSIHRFLLTDSIFQCINAMVENKSETVGTKTWYKNDKLLVQKPGTNVPCSSSIYKTTTTENNLKLLDDVDLSYWGIAKQGLVQHIGKDGICETTEEIEEFLNQVKAVICEKEKKNEKIHSKAGFLISCLKKGYITPPDGYISLQEQRIIETKQAKEKEFYRIKQAKKESYKVDYDLFKQNIHENEKNKIYANAEKNEVVQEGGKISVFIRQKALEGEVEEKFKELFLNQLKSAQRSEAISLLFENHE